MYSRNLLIEKVQLAILDAVVVFVCALGATWLRHGAGWLADGPASDVPWSSYILPSALVALTCVLLFRYHRLYGRPLGRLDEALRVAQACGVATLTVVAVTFFYRAHSYSRATVILFYPLAVVATLAARSSFRVYGRAVLRHHAAARRVLIVGFGTIGKRLGRSLLENPSYYELVGFLDDDPATHQATLQGVPVLGSTAGLSECVREHRVHEVLLAIPSAPEQRMMALLGQCMRLKVHWKFVPKLFDLRIERMNFDEINGIPVVALRGSRLLGFNWALKRAFDLALTSVALLLASPLLLLIASAVRLTSSGPVLFRQTRIGLGGRPFVFLKFRSMRVDNDASAHVKYTGDWIYGRTGRAPEARSLGAAAGRVDAAPLHKIVADPRVTPVGHWLRRTSLDELPQLWNVFRGDMSIVGPRPPLPYEVERYTEWHKRRLEVLPGITGLWQVSGRNRLSFDEMVRLDIRYIETWSLEEDVKIVLKTIPVVLFDKAY